jgi:hypothetical protein
VLVFLLRQKLHSNQDGIIKFKKRASKKLDITKKSGNFWTIKTDFRSSIFEISNCNNKRANNSIAFIQKCGTLRNISTYFNYELVVVIGYFTESDSDAIVVNAHKRIGYNF